MKKGQATTLIVIGLLLVTLVTSIMYIRNISIEGSQETSVSRSYSVPKEIKPIHGLIQECLEDYSLYGVNILGLQGGHIYAPRNVPFVEVQNDESKNVIFGGGDIRVREGGTGINKVPFWIDSEGMAIPSKNYMESQLESYVENGLRICTQNFNQFIQEGFSVEQENIEVDINMAKQVVVGVKWPLTITRKGVEYELENFGHAIPVNFELIHEIAEELAIKEATHNFLETHAKNLISLYSYSGGVKDSYDLPPTIFIDTNTNCDYITWNQNEVKQDLKEIFSDNFKHLKIGGTNYDILQVADSMSQGVYEGFVRNYFINKPSISVDINYFPIYDMVVEVRPNRAGTIKPDRISQSDIPFLPSFCTFKYNSKYDIKTPIIIKIHDADSASINGNSVNREGGFNFYLPIELYLCGNQERGCTGPAIPFRLSDSLASQVYDCDSYSGEINSYVLDEFGNSLENVDVTHTCEGYVNECYLGKTDVSGNIRTRLPSCNNANITLNKEGYGVVEDVIKDSYSLYPMQEFNVELKLVKVDEFMRNYHLSQGFRQSSCGSSPDELLNSIKRNVGSEDQVMVGLDGPIGSTPSFIYPGTPHITIGEGEYNINTVVNGMVVIRPSNYLVEENLLGSDEYITIDFDGNPLVHQNYEGMWLLGNTQILWDIDRNDMIGNTITFYALVEHLSSDDLEVKDFDVQLISDGGLSGEIYADTNCDGFAETINVQIDERDYSRFLEPEII